jgi:hypothetical protein
MKFRLMLVVWGDWHLDQLTSHGLPSLRAPGNLDAIDYHISAHTRLADRDRLAAVLDGFSATVHVTLPDDVKSDQATSNSTVFGCNMLVRATAAGMGEAWGLLAPDMVWGEGTWAHHRQALESGKTAVFRPLLRVDASKTGTITDFSKRHLAKLALECEHSVAKTCFRATGEKFTQHAEMVIWETPGGIINRTITAEVQTCIPSAVWLNGAGLAGPSLEGQMSVVADSDECITLAMCPPDKDFGWLNGNGPLTPEVVRAFLRSYDSQASQHIARQSFRLHCEDIDPAAWEESERRAAAFIDEVLGDEHPRSIDHRKGEAAGTRAGAGQVCIPARA